MSVSYPQSAILLPVPPLARHLQFVLKPGATRGIVVDVLRRLSSGDSRIDGTACVAGFGPSLLELIGLKVPGLRAFPNLVGAGVDVPATQYALWIWLRGEDRGKLLLRSRAIERALALGFEPADTIDAFVYDGGRDLTGYEDGTENPKGEDASAAAIVADPAIAPVGSSFVAVQRWQHDLARFEAMSKPEQDHSVGRERISNEELEDAPESAHVKRTAQESFEPEAFVVRRSMPWAEGGRAGLVFVAFGATLDSFEQQLRRMAGLDDGITDALFRFTRPVTGAYYWCPPITDGCLALPLD